MKHFLTDLQSLDDRAKFKVLIVATAVVMVVVVYFWLAYFNNIIASVQTPLAADGGASQNATPAAQEEAGPWTIVMRAPAFLYGEFMGAMRWLGNVLQAPRQYIVQPPQ